MDGKTLFPVMEMGFFVLDFLYFDILMKHACTGFRFWKEIDRKESVKFRADFLAYREFIIFPT